MKTSLRARGPPVFSAALRCLRILYIGRIGSDSECFLHVAVQLIRYFVFFSICCYAVANVFWWDVSFNYAIGVAQTSRLVDFSALLRRLKLTSHWSYKGRNRIRNPHLCSISKQLKCKTNSYSECAPRDMCDYITQIERQNAGFKQLIVQVS